MNQDSKSELYIKGLNLIIENKPEEAVELLSVEYQNYPSEIELVHLLISSYILTQEKDILINFLRKEEQISLFRNKLGYIRNIISRETDPGLYTIGSELIKRNWRNDANIYFRIHSILSPDHDKSLIPLGEDAFAKNEYSKGISFFSKAADNYFTNREKRGNI